MVARTEQKARLLDLVAEVLDLTREGHRNVDDVSSVLQAIKDDPNFAGRLLSRRWPIWKAIYVGGKDVGQLMREIEQAGCKISSWAQDMMRQKKSFKTSSESQQVNFVKLKVCNLGFEERPTTDELYAKALSQGLELCLLEDGPMLRANYLDQPNREVLWIAMEQIADSVDGLIVFELSHGSDVLWLDGSVAHPGIHWNLGLEIVFRLSKKSS